MRTYPTAVRILSAGLVALATACQEAVEGPPADCNTSSLTVSVQSISNPSDCRTQNGSLTLLAAGGRPPYGYTINDGFLRSSPIFEGLLPGEYVLSARDAAGCARQVRAVLSAPGDAVDAFIQVSKDGGCLKPEGVIRIVAFGGQPPYRYKIDSEPYGRDSLIGPVLHGKYNVTVADSQDCMAVFRVDVPRGTTIVRYSKHVKPIFDRYCNLPTCHNGDLGEFRDFTKYEQIKIFAKIIGRRAVNRQDPPGSYPKPDETEITMLLCWINDGAFNN